MTGFLPVFNAENITTMNLISAPNIRAGTFQNVSGREKTASPDRQFRR
jgi:hypothetical protein